MGAVLGSAMKETMDENMKKNQEFMLQTQKMTVRNNVIVKMYVRLKSFGDNGSVELNNQ